MIKQQTVKQPLLNYLIIYPTDRCNLKCQHCYINPVYDTEHTVHVDEVSYDHICSVINELLPFGLRECKLSGGEPFLRDDLTDICRYLYSKKVRIAIESNGTRIRKSDADVLGELCDHLVVAVSLDGANADTHDAFRGVPGCFHEAVRGIEYLVQAGVTVQVISCLFEENRNELSRLMEICAKVGVKSFKLNCISPIGRAKHLSLIDLPEVYEIDTQLSNHASVAGIRYCSAVPLGLQSVSQMIETCALNGRCNICSTLGILADGTITICGMGKYIDELKFGKLGENSAAEIWVTHPALNLIRTGIPSKLRGICGRCIARSSCLGVCRLNNENTTLDSLFDPFWQCDRMETLGLFPESRIVERTEITS